MWSPTLDLVLPTFLFLPETFHSLLFWGGGNEGLEKSVRVWRRNQNTESERTKFVKIDQKCEKGKELRNEEKGKNHCSYLFSVCIYSRNTSPLPPL